MDPSFYALYPNFFQIHISYVNSINQYQGIQNG